MNAAFSVHLANGAAVELRLIDVRPLATRMHGLPNAEDAQNEKFALLFRGPLASPLAQSTHAFEHPRIGRFAMFIVPIGCNDRSHCYYEAIFNRPARRPQAQNLRGQTGQTEPETKHYG